MSALLGGKYVLDRRLGGGGMAEVFLGYAVGVEGFRRPVAIKRVLPGYADSPQFAEMFIAEARISSQLQHANIVSVLDFVRDPDAGLFLVMEYIDGPSLDAYLKAGLLPVPAVIHVITEILRGLEHAHEIVILEEGIRGIVHRDISPHNVLLSRDGGVKIADFGIAKARVTTDATSSTVLKGKPAYMSPEQANGEPLDGRSDLFAVGVMLWEMLCGRPLFLGFSMQETLSRLLFAPILSPRQLRPELRQDLEHVTMRLLNRDRTSRYPTANAAMVDLIACREYPRSGRELLRGLIGAHASTTSDPSGVVTGARTALDARRPLPTPNEGRKASASRNMWPLVVAMGLLGVALALFLSSRVDRSSPAKDSDDRGSTGLVDSQIVATEHPDAHLAAHVVLVNPIDGAPTDGAPMDARGAPVRRKRVDAQLPAHAVQAPVVIDAAVSPPTTVVDAAEKTNIPASTQARITIRGVELKDGAIDVAAVKRVWSAQRSRLQKCFQDTWRAYLAEGIDTKWLNTSVGFTFLLAADGTFSWKHTWTGTDELPVCVRRVATSAPFPRPTSTQAELWIGTVFDSCVRVWEMDASNGRPRTPCP